MQLITVAKLRVAFDLPLAGEDETLDEQLYSSVAEFFDFKTYEDGKLDESVASRYVSWLSESETCTDLREKYFCIFFWSSPSEADKRALSKAFQSLYGAELKQLSHSDIWALYVDIKALWKSTRKSLRESKAQKIDFRLKELTMLIPWISSALVCSGYIYTSVIYEHFSVDPTRFFSVGDYLGSSLEQIDHALFALLGYILGVIHGYRRQFMIPRRHERIGALRKWWPELQTIAIGAVFLAFAYWHWDIVSTIKGIHIFALIALLMTVQAPLMWLTDRYFRNSLSVDLFAMVLIIFFGSIFIGAKTRISDITSDVDSAPFEVVSKENRYTQQNYKIIGATSRYMFFWDRVARVEVVPLSAIEQMSFADDR